MITKPEIYWSMEDTYVWWYTFESGRGLDEHEVNALALLRALGARVDITHAREGRIKITTNNTELANTIDEALQLVTLEKSSGSLKCSRSRRRRPKAPSTWKLNRA